MIEDLLQAIRSNDISEVKRHLNEKIDIEQEGRFGAKPLIIAAGYGHIEIVKLLLDYGADVNTCRFDGNTALHLAVVNKHFDVVRLLTHYGADANRKNKNGNSAFDTVCIMYSTKDA